MKSGNNIKVLYKRIDNILSNLSAQDWWIINKNSPIAKYGEYTNTMRRRHWLPYSLSEETLEVLEVLKLIKESMSKEDEEKVKSLIMKYRIIAPEYVEDAHYYIKNKNNIEPIKISI